MSIIDRYVFRNLLIATAFITLVLSALVLLTQSLRFLDLIMTSGASGWSFWALSLLALPRFFEVLIPIGLMASVLFVYNKFTIESELVVLRALGFSPLRLARPAIVLAALLSVFLFVSLSWIAPLSTASMQSKRVYLKAQMSTLLFREGVFNQAGKGLMVYLRDRDSSGEMRGLVIHDARKKGEDASTIIAKRGLIVATDDGNQVIVYDGARQSFDPEKRVLNRLNFDQYIIDLPDESGPVRKRWKEPEERTTWALFQPNLSDARDLDAKREFQTEIYKRFATPFMVLSFTITGLCLLLLGPVERRGQSRRILLAIGIIVMLQVAFLVVSNLAKQSLIGVPLMFAVAILPSIIGVTALIHFGQKGVKALRPPHEDKEQAAS